MSTGTIEQIIGAGIVVALLAFAALFIYQGADEHVDALIVCALGIVAYVVKSPRDNGPKVPPLPVLMLVLAALPLLGCEDPIRDQARAAVVSAGVLTAGGDVVMAARSAALDRVEAAHPTDPEHDAALDAEAERWRPALAALDGARTALLAWVDALDLARLAGGGADLLAPIATVAARAVQLVARAFAIAAELGVEDLPAIPPILTGLADSIGGR